MSNLIINRKVPLQSSLRWIRLSYYVFRESFLHFIVLGMACAVASIIPVVGAFMLPLCIARVATIVNEIEKGQTERTKFTQIFHGLFANPTLVKLAYLNMLFSTLILLGQFLVESYFPDKSVQSIALFSALIPTLFLQLAMWMSPFICLFNPETTPKHAMGLSIKAGLYNVVTLTIYSIIIVVPLIVVILLMLYFILMLPKFAFIFGTLMVVLVAIWMLIVYIANYYVYQEMFHPDLNTKVG